MHVLAGRDVTSKIGTKAAALKAQPENFLMNFCEHTSLTDENLNAAEDKAYLVHFIKINTKSKIFNHL